MVFDKDQAAKLINGFLRNWATQLGRISERPSGVFEVFSTMLVMLGLRRNGFRIYAQNLRKGVFVAKGGTRGDPRTYSFFVAERNTEKYEIRQNQDVIGCHQGFYVINEDIVIIEQDSLTGSAISQSNVVTFASCKHLPCFPSLIADFIGEINELQYSRLQSGTTHNLPPALFLTSGAITRGGQNLMNSLQRLRGYNIRIYGDLTPSQFNRSIRNFLTTWRI